MVLAKKAFAHIVWQLGPTPELRILIPWAVTPGFPWALARAAADSQVSPGIVFTQLEQQSL
jgi:hypothetical protein